MGSENELGAFLRARRDLVSPADTGLPSHRSRRVRGLRREEVALLAGMSTDYYTRLEQGRERHPSEQVLDAVARALRLDHDAATHLFRLAQPASQTAAAVATHEVSPELRRLLDSFVAAPAFVVGPAMDILAANEHARELYSAFARMDNLLRMVFLDPAARKFYLDWDASAAGVVGNLRALSGPFRCDPRVCAVVGELTLASPAFAEVWARYDVRRKGHERKRLWHAEVGELTLDFQSFTVSAALGQQLNVYSAEPGTPDADALILLRHLKTSRAHVSSSPIDSSHNNGSRINGGKR